MVQFVSCAGGPSSPPPVWVQDAEEAYPSSRYITGRGYGADRKNAEVSALNALSSFFITEVQSRVKASRSYSERDGKVEMNQEFDESIFVKNQTQLFAVRYADAWRNPVTKEYEILGYINREEAWNIYEPRVRQKADTLRGVCKEAETNTEPLKKIILYSSAQVTGAEILRLLEFARLLDWENARTFDDVQDIVAGLSAKTEALKSGIRVYINSPAGVDSLVSSAIAKAFSSHGFSVSRERETASHICDVTVEGNMQNLQAGTFYTPSVMVTVSNKGGVVFTYTANLSRVGAMNPDVAKRRASTAIAGEIEKSFFTGFMEEVMP
jgi:hypothetical protein